MSTGFIQLLRDSQELFLKDHQVFDFMMLCAFRARWKETSINSDGTKLGEAYVGRDDVKKIFGWGERVYRNVKKRVEHKYKLATCKGSSQGTIVKLIDNRFCDLKVNGDDEQKDEQKVEPKPWGGDEQGTSKGRATGHLTKNKKEERRLGELTIVRSTPTPPKIENGGGGGKRKIAFIYEGTISKKAYAASDLSAKHEIPIRPDIIQRWIDEYGIDAVRLQFQATITAVKKGAQITRPANYVSRRLINNHLTLEQQLLGEENVDRSASAQC